MPLTSSQIGESLKLVWDALIGLELEEASAFEPQEVVRVIEIEGEWRGRVGLHCSAALARRAAAAMFMMEETELSEDDINDALGEVTNMVAGNLKGALPGPSYLTPPQVLCGHQMLASGASPSASVAFLCDQETPWGLNNSNRVS